MRDNLFKLSLWAIIATGVVFATVEVKRYRNSVTIEENVAEAAIRDKDSGWEYVGKDMWRYHNDEVTCYVKDSGLSCKFK